MLFASFPWEVSEHKIRTGFWELQHEKHVSCRHRSFRIFPKSKHLQLAASRVAECFFKFSALCSMLQFVSIQRVTIPTCSLFGTALFCQSFSIPLCTAPSCYVVLSEHVACAFTCNEQGDETGCSEQPASEQFNALCCLGWRAIALSAAWAREINCWRWIPFRIPLKLSSGKLKTHLLIKTQLVQVRSGRTPYC